jgi:hypothetical protein
MKLHSLLVTSALVISVITSTTSAHAISAAEYENFTELAMPGYIEEFADALNNAQLVHDTSYPFSTTDVDDKCTAMMDGKLVSGEVGTMISQLFLDNTKALHANSKALDNIPEENKLKTFDNLYTGGTVKTKYCPMYSKMTAKERSIVWVFILTAMAHFESNCTKYASNKAGPNGIAYGYYQLHKGKEQNYDGDKAICMQGDAGKPVAASKCTMAMLEKQFEVREGELFSSKSYWDVLRPSGSSGKWAVIRKALMNSSLCNPKTI